MKLERGQVEKSSTSDCSRSNGQTIFADALRDDGKRFIVHADQAFVEFERANSPQDESAVADLPRKWSTIPKATPAFRNQPSRFTAWRLFVSRALTLTTV